MSDEHARLRAVVRCPCGQPRCEHYSILALSSNDVRALLDAHADQAAQLAALRIERDELVQNLRATAAASAERGEREARYERALRAIAEERPAVLALQAIVDAALEGKDAD